MSRTRRHPYTGAKAIDASCRNAGSDPFARRSRLYQGQRALEAAKEAEREIEIDFDAGQTSEIESGKWYRLGSKVLKAPKEYE